MFVRESECLRRAEDTLLLMHRWGYAPTLDALAEGMLGGRVEPETLRRAVELSKSVRCIDGFLCARGWERLIDSSKGRVASNSRVNPGARRIARDFARDLTRAIPFVEAVALTGSVASGGYEPGDDIDFDLFVRSGTKYICYLAATMIGLRYSWRYRHVRLSPLHRTPLLPKIICVNVVWPSDQSHPFLRQDAGMAFELLHCEPLVGSERFGRVLADNPWLSEYFPQIFERVRVDTVSRQPGGIARFLSALERRPRLLKVIESASRRLAWVAYLVVQAGRKGDPAARARMEFLRRVKYPYEVFQD